jgi:hypothetical protein
MTIALTRTLRHHAEEAPSTAGLTEKAMAIASRRRRRRVNVAIAAAVVLAAGIPVAVVATLDADRGTPSTASQANPTWRWESYGGVQVQVPPDWTYGVLGAAWCAGQSADETRQVRPGAVGRPGPVPAIGCGSEFPPVSERESWLTFHHGGQVGERSFDAGWVEETRQVNGEFVTVFTNDAALRKAILGSAEPIVGFDRHGCASNHPAVADGYRPDSANGGLPQASAVESISVCRYALDSATPLLSSSRVGGAAAKELVAAIQSAPEGEGPDVENAATDSHGTEVVVLRIHTADTAHEVLVRYSGESGNGFDDGTTKRELTADAIRPLLAGANQPGQYSLPVAGLLHD